MNSFKKAVSSAIVIAICFLSVNTCWARRNDRYRGRPETQMSVRESWDQLFVDDTNMQTPAKAARRPDFNESRKEIIKF